MRPAEARHAEGAVANSRAAETRDAEGASTDARPAETRPAEGANAPEASAARGKAAVAAKAATVTAKTPAVPPEASSACVGFKREKRNREEQHRGSANAGHRPPAPGA
jgi:hypothetical protein